MALVGYAPVSSMEQSLEVQRDKLKHCHKVFEEQKSGTSDQRPRLKAGLEYLGKGILWSSHDWIVWPVPPCICVKWLTYSKVSGWICRSLIRIFISPC